MYKCGKIRKIKRAIGEAMKEIIDNLKGNEILYEQSIEILKNYIAMKYPDENEPYRARVFADAVHKIIDDHIKEFRRDDQKAIKKELLTNAVDSNSFEINAYDILKTCVSLELDESVFAEDLTRWINHQQEITVEAEMIHQITEVVKEEIIREVDEALEKAFETIEREPETQVQAQESDGAYVQGLTNQFEADLMSQLEAAFADIEEETPVVKERVTFDEEIIQEVVETEEVEAHEQYDEFLSDGLVVSGMKPKADSLNMFNLADTIFEDEDKENEDKENEIEDDEDELLDEDRPVIKIERERQVDVLEVIDEYEEVMTEPEAPLSFKEEVEEWLRSGRYKKDLKKALPFIIGFIALVVVLYIVVTSVDFGSEDPIDEETSTSVEIEQVEIVPQQTTPIEETLTITKSKRMDGSNLHSTIQYKEIDQEKLKVWLVRRNSLLAQDEYFDILIEVAEDYDVNPLLLFAITGQEQNFVQRDHTDAKEMINNPFNVYVSWETFNTTLLESTQIASKTIHTLSENLPEGTDPIKWINESGYAEDERWHEGVTLILKQLEVVAGRP